jgi:cellulose synthase/poly-beta-1,6-N-acetylglucosamine synthase-like glycosyltransferase
MYVITIAIFVFGFNKVKEFKPKNLELKTRFTVVIPFRNEANNLPKLLESINALEYAKNSVEFLFVDDDSIDDSCSIIQKFFINNQYNTQVLKNIRLSNSPKKDAITTALKASSKEWVITTDADCVLPKNWLKIIDNFIQQKDCNMVVAPVTYLANNSFLHQFQLLDFLSLQASTISGFGLQNPFLCNGANLVYKKEVFTKVNGFDNNNSIASGDDIFLLEKFLQFDQPKVAYLKSNKAIVKTFPTNTFNKLVHQRVRWASKAASYNLLFGKLIGILILFGNSIVALSPLLVYLQIISSTTAISYFILKLLIDSILIKKVSHFYNQELSFSKYILSSICYPYFTLFIFLKSTFSSYTWKERTFNQ